MKIFKSIFTVVFALVLIFSIAAETISVERPLVTFDMKEIGFDLKKFLANTYYDTETRQKILIKFNDTNSSYFDEPALAGYIGEKMKLYLDKQPQLKTTTSNKEGAKFILELHVIKLKDKIRLLANILNEEKYIIYSTIKDFETNEILDKNFLAFKKDYKIKSKYARLIIREVERAGMSMKAADEKAIKKYEYEKRGYTYKNGTRIETKTTKMSRKGRRLREKKVGDSAAYPAREEVRLNGKLLNDKDGVFFNGKVRPGRLHFTASFEEGYWDALTARQTLGKKHTKEFHIDANDNENLEVLVSFIMSAKGSYVQVKAYTRKKVKVGNQTKVRKKVKKIAFLRQ